MKIIIQIFFLGVVSVTANTQELPPTIYLFNGKEYELDEAPILNVKNIDSINVDKNDRIVSIYLNPRIKLLTVEQLIRMSKIKNYSEDLTIAVDDSLKTNQSILRVDKAAIRKYRYSAGNGSQPDTLKIFTRYYKKKSKDKVAEQQIYIR